MSSHTNKFSPDMMCSAIKAEWVALMEPHAPACIVMTPRAINCA